MGTNKNELKASSRSVRDDMRALSETAKTRESLPPVPKRGSMVSVRGVGSWAGTGDGSGGGINSPLIEEPYSRIYGDELCVVPPSGFFAYCIRPVTRLKFNDAAGEEVYVNFDPLSYQSESSA